MRAQNEVRWLLLIHQIPPKPNYFRVKVGRRLARVGAVPIKNSVYVLPKMEQTLEDFQWILREIVEEGGEAALCEAGFLDGLCDDQIEALFLTARDADYRQLEEEIRRILEPLPPGTVDEEKRAALESELSRMRRKLAEIAVVDFFGAPAGRSVEALLTGLEARLRPAAEVGARQEVSEMYHGRTWVTRMGVKIDRIASAWLIRRFIDPDARFKFVSHQGYVPAEGELRFDMFEAEFTHEGDRCTFEVLLERLGLREPGLEAIAGVVHDIDLKDGRFGRPETAGIARLIDGLVTAHRADDDRLARGFALFDDLLESFRRD